MDELASYDATALADLVRRRQVQPREIVEAAIARIARLNPKLNAVVTPMYDLARAQAEAPLGDGPFAGVPFLLKDLLAEHAGVRRTNGCAFLEGHVDTRDSELVRRLKRAGLIILGKTSTPELGILPTTEPKLFGPCGNPWDLARTTGGSSGGSAAAVAAGLVPMAHANDGGGSIRIPASCCGLFGMKPTRARNPLGPSFGDMYHGFVCEHAVTRSVRDSAALLDATSGPDVGDPYHAPPRARPFSEEVGAPPGRLRIALSTKTLTGVPVHADCVAAALDAGSLLAELGHEVVPRDLELDGNLLAPAFIGIWAAGCAWAVEGAALVSGRKPTPDKFEPLTWALYQMGRGASAANHLLALTLVQRMARDVARAFLEFDVMLTPTLAEPPVPLGTFDASPDNPIGPLFRAGAFAPFTPIANITGQPAMSMPLYWNQAGLPIGTQFIGRFGDEATLFRLAAQLEQARPWAGRRPPAWA